MVTTGQMSPNVSHRFGLLLLLAVGPRPGLGLPSIKQAKSMIAMEVKPTGALNSGVKGGDTILTKEATMPLVHEHGVTPGSPSQLDKVDLCGHTCQETIEKMSAYFYLPCKAVYVPPCAKKPEGFTSEMEVRELCPHACPPEPHYESVPQPVQAEPVQTKASKAPLLNTLSVFRLPLFILSAIAVIAIRYLPGVLFDRGGKDCCDKFGVLKGHALATDVDNAADEDSDDGGDVAIPNPRSLWGPHLAVGPQSSTNRL